MPDAATLPGTAVVLNGAPRSGKSSIALAIQQHVAGTVDEPRRRSIH